MFRNLTAALKRSILQRTLPSSFNKQIAQYKKERFQRSLQIEQQHELLEIDQGEKEIGFNWFGTNTATPNGAKAQKVSDSRASSQIKKEIKLFDFEESSTLTLCKLKEDHDAGGLSTASLGYCNETSSLKFEGRIRYEEKDLLEFEPSIEVQIATKRKFCFEQLSGIRIHYYTSGSNLPLDFVVCRQGMLQEGGYLTGTLSNLNKGWHTMDIPFSHLRMSKGKVPLTVQEEKLKFFEYDTEKTRLYSNSFIFIVESLKQESFEFKVKTVSVFYDDQISRIDELVNKRPIFYKTPTDYGKMQYEDYSTGEERYSGL